MKKFLTNIILCIVVIAGLIFTGVKTIKTKTVVSEKESSFALTDFEYVVISPSKDQVSEFKNNTEAIKNIFPCVKFTAPLKTEYTKEMTLLASDYISDFGISLFNDKTLLSGKYEPNCIQLDKTAAEELHVQVGDYVSFSLAYREYKLKVCAIYMASTYKFMDKGLALIELTDEIKSGFKIKLTYDCAFIDENDSTKCANLLKDYKPLANLQTLEEYMAEEKEHNNCPPTLTEEEWNAQIENAYNEYKNSYLGQDFKDYLQNKNDFMEDIKEQTTTTVTKINYMLISVAIGVVLLYTFLDILFMYSNKQDDLKCIKDGLKLNRLKQQYILVALVGAIFIALVTFLGLFLYSRNSHFTNSYNVIIYTFSLSVLISLIFIIPYISKYIDTLDKAYVINNLKNDSNELVQDKKVEEYIIKKKENKNNTTTLPKEDKSFKVDDKVIQAYKKDNNDTSSYHKEALNTPIDSAKEALRLLKTNVLIAKENNEIKYYFALLDLENEEIISCINSNQVMRVNLKKRKFAAYIKKYVVYVYKPISVLTNEERKIFGFKQIN